MCVWKSAYLRAACMIPHAMSLLMYCNLEQLSEIKASAMQGNVHMPPMYGEKIGEHVR